MPMQLEIDGQIFERFSEAEAYRSMETICGSFKFVSSVVDPESFPFKQGSSCRVLIDKVPIINGFIEALSVEYDTGSHTVTVEGRDRTSDIVDSSAIDTTTFTPPVSLVHVIERTLGANKLSHIGVINRVSDIKDFQEGDLVTAEPGESIFHFLERYARKLQVLLTKTRDGNISIERADILTAGIHLVNVKGAAENNIKRARVVYRDTELFNEYHVRSQQAPSALGASISADSTVNQVGVATDSSVRTSRRLEIVSESANAAQTNEERAAWESNIRRARSFEYSCTVQGFYRDKEHTLFWRPNRFVPVKDDFADIDAKLLIRAVRYKYSTTTGSTCDLDLTTSDAFTLQAERDQREATVNKQGSGFSEFIS